jgi:hypothetical protein
MAEAGITVHADEFVRRLVRMQRPALDQPVALGLVDTTNSARSKAASPIGRRTGLRVGTVRTRIYFDHVKVGNYQVIVRSSRRPMPLIEFPSVRQAAGGVRTSVWGRAELLQGAFIAPTTRGGQQVFRRRSPSGGLRFAHPPYTVARDRIRRRR